jgi:hypothetical protein
MQRQGTEWILIHEAQEALAIDLLGFEVAGEAIVKFDGLGGHAVVVLNYRRFSKTAKAWV